MPGRIPGQGVKQPPLGFIPPAAIPGASHPYIPPCLHVAPLETQAVLSVSQTKNIPMVQDGLCVISHNLGEESTTNYLRAVKTYKNVLGSMGHELDPEKMCGQKSEPAQAVPALVLCSSVDVTKLSYFGPFVPATVLFYNQCQANFYPFKKIIFIFYKGQMSPFLVLCCVLALKCFLYLKVFVCLLGINYVIHLAMLSAVAAWFCCLQLLK